MGNLNHGINKLPVVVMITVEVIAIIVGIVVVVNTNLRRLKKFSCIDT